MDGFNNINPGDKSSATSNATVEQPRTQQQQAEFEQHLGDVRQVDAVYPHRDLLTSLTKTTASFKQPLAPPSSGDHRRALPQSVSTIVDFANWLRR